MKRYLKMLGVATGAVVIGILLFWFVVAMILGLFGNWEWLDAFGSIMAVLIVVAVSLAFSGGLFIMLLACFDKFDELRKR